MNTTISSATLDALREFANGKTTERNINILLKYGGVIKKIHEDVDVQYYNDSTTNDYVLTPLGEKILAENPV